MYIRECHNLVNLCDLKSLRYASNLRKCYTDNCNKMTHVFCQTSYDHPFVQNLQYLQLYSLWNLQDLIWRDTTSTSSSAGHLKLPTGTFSFLKVFPICKCPKIKSLFTPALLFHLKNLETLTVHRCERLEEIIGDDDLDEEAVASTVLFSTFSKFKKIRCAKLPELKSFRSNRKMISDSLEGVYITKCPKLERFPLLREDPHPPTLLRKIRVDEEWWESVEFDHPNTRDILRPVRDFRRYNRDIY